MSELKTKINDKSPYEYVTSIENDIRREDSLVLLDVFKKVTGESPKMWGDKIIGYGQYHYKYASGREGDWLLTGFAAGKQKLSLYIMSGFTELSESLSRLGKHKLGKGCLYINKLSDVDMDVLEEIIKKSIELVNEERIRYE